MKQMTSGLEKKILLPLGSLGLISFRKNTRPSIPEENFLIGSGELVYTRNMIKAEIRRQVLKLPKQERLALALDIWTSIEDPDALALLDWQRKLLDERLAAAPGEEAIEWGNVQAKIWHSEK
jgi:putative addiction module component (TIGR02574 family)